MTHPTLDDLLDEWTVHGPGEWSNEHQIPGWFAVSNNNGIVAYFADEASAFRFRLNEINRVLNG